MALQCLDDSTCGKMNGNVEKTTTSKNVVQFLTPQKCASLALKTSSMGPPLPSNLRPFATQGQHPEHSRPQEQVPQLPTEIAPQARRECAAPDGS